MPRRSRLALVLPLAAAVLVLALACGGASEEAKPPQTGVSEPAATATPEAALAKLPKPVPLSPPPGATELLSGPPDHAAAKRLRDALAAAGFSLKEDALYVLSIRGSQERILCVPFDETASGSINDSKFLPALITAVAADPAKITRFTFDLRGEDSVGPFVLTMTMSVEVAKAMTSGAPPPEIGRQVIYDLKRGPQ